MRSNSPILLVEDDTVDQMLVRRAFRDVGIVNRLDVATDGEAALRYLERAGNALPCLILLDLNMPRLSGLELLRAIKRDARLAHIPVIVLTTSSAEPDREACFRLSVAGYMVKPIGYPAFVELIRVIDSYWTLSELPP